MSENESIVRESSGSQSLSGHRFETGKIVRSRSTGFYYRVLGYTPEGKVQVHRVVLKGTADPVFKCLECGHRFKSVKSAERAAFGNEGCPGCGGSDIDLNTEKVA